MFIVDIKDGAELELHAIALNGGNADFLYLPVIVDDVIGLAPDGGDDVARGRENGLKEEVVKWSNFSPSGEGVFASC